MPWHHVIPRHEWKRRFGNLRGLNEPDNLVNLTTEQHAQVHQLLAELNGSQYDTIASLTISKQIGKEEAQKRAASFANSGKKRALGVKRTIEQNAARSEWMRGNKNGVVAMSGKSHSQESRQKISDANSDRVPWNVGVPHTPEAKEKMRQRATGRVVSVEIRKRISESMKQVRAERGWSTKKK